MAASEDPIGAAAKLLDPDLGRRALELLGRPPGHGEL
jgi:hypothetical protein